MSQQYYDLCHLCNRITLPEWSVPTYFGDVVSNDFPDHLWMAHGGSKPVCEPCYNKHERGEVPTYDHRYVRPGLMGVILTDGGGI